MQREEMEVEEASSSSQSLPSSSALRITWHNIECYVKDKSKPKSKRANAKEGEAEERVLDGDGDSVSVQIEDSPHPPPSSSPSSSGIEVDSQDSESAEPLYLRVFSCGRGRDQKKRVLHSVSGSVGPGEILCIMGPSGAGKSTLMDIICGRKKPNNGVVLANGVRLSSSQWKRRVAYVPQEDILVASLTVYETLRMYANLKLPRKDFTDEQKRERVMELIHTLHLTKAKDSLVGDTLIPGISGGEKKRLAIAIQLISNPPAIFLDEPTSGLDSSTAMVFFQIMMSLADSGHTIVCTLHQPSSALYALFDRLYLMADGYTIYSGKAKDAIGYFASAGFQCPAYVNPSDYFLDVLTCFGLSLNDAVERKIRLKDYYLEHEESADQHSAGESAEGPPKERERRFTLTRKMTATEELAVGGYAAMPTSVPHQIAILVGRNARRAIRDPGYLRLRAISTIFLSVVLGFFFLQLDWSQAGAQSRVGLIGLFAIMMIFNTASAVAVSFPLDKVLFVRDRANDMYTIAAYYVSLLVVELPSLIFFPYVGTTIVYWMSGMQQGADKYFQFMIFPVLMSCTGAAAGMCVGCSVSSVQMAAAILPLVCIFFILSSGFFVVLNQIPVWLRWLHYISPVRYAFEAMMYIVFHDQPMYCTSQELSQNRTCPLTNGNDVLAQYGFSDESGAVWVENIGILAALYFGFSFIAYAFLVHFDYKINKNK